MRDVWKEYLSCRQSYPKEFADGAPAGLRLDDDAPKLAGAALGIVERHPRWLWVREWNGSTISERPVYLDPGLKKQIEGYFALVDRRPDLFAPSNLIPICMDRRAMLSFTEKTGKPVGLTFDNGIFYQVVADLVEGPQPYAYGRVLYPGVQGSGRGIVPRFLQERAPSLFGILHIFRHSLRQMGQAVADLVKGPRPYAYGRVLYPDAKGSGTVIVPRFLQEEAPPLFGILHIFRHSIRQLSSGEFPRGFQAPGITPEDNACKELSEEFGVSPRQIVNLTLLGKARPDTGLRSGEVQIYLADLAGKLPQANVGSEGIASFEWISEEELLARIRRGEILDGMTQTAVLLYQLSAAMPPTSGNGRQSSR